MATSRHKAVLEFEGRFGNATSAYDRLRRKQGETTRATEESNRRTERSWSKVVLSIVGVIAVYKTLSGTISSVTGVVKSGIAEYTKLETAMAEVATISDEVLANQLEYRREVEMFARRYGLDAADVAKGLYQTISAGITDASDASTVLNQSLRFGIAAIVDAETSVDLLTTVLNSYGMEAQEAERVSDLLFTTIRLGKTTGNQLAGSLGRVTAIAKVAGVELEELLGVLVLLTRGGLSTDEAVTQIRATMLGIVAPTEQTKDAIAALNLEMFNAEGLKKVGLLGVLEELAEKGGDNIEVATELFPNIRALVGAMAAIGQSHSAAEVMEALAESTGATTAAVEIMMGTWDKMFDQIGEGWDQLKSRIGEGFLAIIGKDSVKELGSAFDAFLQKVDFLQGLFAPLIEDDPEMFETFLDNIVNAYENTLGVVLPDIMSRFVQATAAILAGLVKFLEPIWNTIKESVVQTFEDMGTAAGNAFSSAVKNSMLDLMAWLAKEGLFGILGAYGGDFLEGTGAAAEMGGDNPMMNQGGGVGTAARGFLGGGGVRGPSGLDAVPARLSDGEFVMRKEIVDAVGASFFDALNSLPPREVRNVFPNVRSGEGAGAVTERMASGNRRLAVAGGFR